MRLEVTAYGEEPALFFRLGRREAPTSSSPAVEPPPAPRPKVPEPYRVVSDYAWRFVALAAALAIVVYAAASVSLLTIAVAVGLLIAALLSPVHQRLQAWGLPRLASAALTFVGGLAAIAGIGWFVVDQIVTGFDDLNMAVSGGVDRAVDWLESGPLNLESIDLESVRASVATAVQDNRSQLASGALTVASAVSRFLAGLGLALFTAFFFLYDGRRIGSWLIRLFPRHTRSRVDDSAQRGWATLVAYVRGTALVALFDAVLIGIGLVVLDVPLALPLSTLVFLGGFVPLVGAFATGALAVLVALATNGVTTALLALGLILVVQQIEGNVLQPFLLGKLVDVHPVGIVLAVTAGSLLAGIPGAVLAVPVVAVANSVGSRLAELSSTRGEPSTADARPDPDG